MQNKDSQAFIINSIKLKLMNNLDMIIIHCLCLVLVILDKRSLVAGLYILPALAYLLTLSKVKSIFQVNDRSEFMTLPLTSRELIFYIFSHRLISSMLHSLNFIFFIVGIIQSSSKSSSPYDLFGFFIVVFLVGFALEFLLCLGLSIKTLSSLRMVRFNLGKLIEISRAATILCLSLVGIYLLLLIENNFILAIGLISLTSFFIWIIFYRMDMIFFKEQDYWKTLKFNIRYDIISVSFCVLLITSFIVKNPLGHLNDKKNETIRKIKD